MPNFFAARGQEFAIRGLCRSSQSVIAPAWTHPADLVVRVLRFSMCRTRLRNRILSKCSFAR